MLFSLLNTPAAAVRPVPGAPGPGAPAAARVPKRRPHVLREGAARALFGTAAALSIAAVALICLFLLANGVPAMAEIGLPEFLFGTTWRPVNDLYGIFPMIVGSLYVTAGAMIVGVPGGLLTRVVLLAVRSRPHGLLPAQPAVELLAGIPSVVYGFFGLVMHRALRAVCSGRARGFRCWQPALCLGIMILPTVISVARNALCDAVPARYYEGCAGAGRRRTSAAVF